MNGKVRSIFVWIVVMVEVRFFNISMKHLISSRWTNFYKRIFPTLWFGSLASIVATSVVPVFTKGDTTGIDILFLIIVPSLGLLGYYVTRRYLIDLIDEVYDDGDTLVFKNAGRVERIRLSDIINVDDTVSSNPPRITLTLRAASSFGRKITFSPPRQHFTFFRTRNPVARELVHRIDVAQRNQASASRGNITTEEKGIGNGK